MVTEADSIGSIMRKSKTNFFYSSFFLNKIKRDGLKVIYAFCRKTDDIVDNNNMSNTEKRENLNEWRNSLSDALKNNSENLFMNRVTEVVKYFRIPEQYLFDLIKGMEMDIDKTRYENFKELYQYCYFVASCVGLMTIEVFGYEKPSVRNYAIDLGIALQLTNIMRDIKKDAVLNRIYLPLEDLEKFKYSVQQLKSSDYNDNFVDLMKYEYDRTYNYYSKAISNFSLSDEDNLISAKIMQDIYFKILKKIKSINYNVYKYDIRVNRITKLYISLSAFLKLKVFN